MKKPKPKVIGDLPAVVQKGRPQNPAIALAKRNPGKWVETGLTSHSYQYYRHTLSDKGFDVATRNGKLYLCYHGNESE